MFEFANPNLFFYIFTAFCILFAAIFSAATECFKPKEIQTQLDAEFKVDEIQQPDESNVHSKML